MSGLTIGDLARRTGLAVSAIRFYEKIGAELDKTWWNGSLTAARYDQILAI